MQSNTVAYDELTNAIRSRLRETVASFKKRRISYTPLEPHVERLLVELFYHVPMPEDPSAPRMVNEQEAMVALDKSKALYKAGSEDPSIMQAMSLMNLVIYEVINEKYMGIPATAIQTPVAPPKRVKKQPGREEVERKFVRLYEEVEELAKNLDIHDWRIGTWDTPQEALEGVVQGTRNITKTLIAARAPFESQMTEEIDTLFRKLIQTAQQYGRALTQEEKNAGDDTGIV